MAVLYDSITTRYGDTYTDTNDNTSALDALVTGATLSGDNWAITSKNNGISGMSGEYIIFNKHITISSGQRLVGTGVAGVHCWFVNCTFELLGDGTDGQVTIGPAQSQSASIGGRNDPVTDVAGNKSSESSWNFYGCTFVYHGPTADANALGVLMLGALYDCDITTLGSSTNQFRPLPIITPQPGAVVDGLTVNAQASNNALAVSLFTFDVPGSLNRLTLNNTIPYIGNGHDYEFEEYEQKQFTQLSSYDVKYYSVANNTTTHMINPKTELDPNGHILWRNVTNGTPKVIQSQRVTREYFEDALHTDGRKDVKYHISTNGYYTTAGDPTTMSTSASTVQEIEYITGTNGRLNGTKTVIDPLTTLSAQDFPSFEVPVQTVSSAGNLVSINGVNHRVQSSAFDITVNIDEMSLWGTTYSEISKGGVNSSADTNGYWVTPDTGNVTDPDDELMTGYSETISNLTGTFTTTDNTTVSASELAAIYKFGVWNRDIEFSNWSGVVSGSEADVSDRTRSYLRLNSTQSGLFDTTIAADTLSIDTPTDSDGNIGLVIGADDVIQTFKVERLDFDNATGYLEGGNWEFTSSSIGCNNLRTYNSIPTDAQFSAKDADITGTLSVQASGSSNYIKFDNCTGTITLNRTGSGTLFYVTTGDNAPAITAGNGVLPLTQVVLTREDTDVNFTVYNITSGNVAQSSLSTDRLHNETGTDGTFTLASSGGDYSNNLLGGTITKILVVATKEGEDSSIYEVDITPGSSQTIAIGTTANSSYNSGATSQASGITATVIAGGKLQLNCDNSIALSAADTNKTLLDIRNTQGYRDKLAIENSATDIIVPVGLNDTQVDLAELIFATSQLGVYVTLSQRLNESATNTFSESQSATVTISGTDTAATVLVDRREPPTGVGSDALAITKDEIVESNADISGTLFGTPEGGTDRTLNDVFNMARNARNAAYL